MLKIRLQRTGKKNSPSFRVVLAEHTKPVKGKFLEILGFCNPKLKEHDLKKERIQYWLSMGVQVSGTVHNLFVNESIIKDKKVKAWSPKKKSKESEESDGEKESPSPDGSGAPKEEKKDESNEDVKEKIEEKKEVEKQEPAKKEELQEGKPEDKKDDRGDNKESDDKQEDNKKEEK